MLPFVLACIFLLTPRMYLAQHIADYSIMGDDGIPEWNIFKYFILLLPNIIIHMSWLWFLLALFLDSMINYPLLKWTQRRYAGEPITFKEDGLTLIGNLLLHIIWAVAKLVLDGDNFVKSHLPMVLILLFNQLMFHIIPWKLVK